MQAKSGKLRVTICEAKLTRDTEMFSKMDPYCTMFYKNKSYKTNVKNEAGKKPVWNQTFEIAIQNVSDAIKFEVRDQDIMSTDLIGKLECQVWELIGPNNGENKWHKL